MKDSVYKAAVIGTIFLTSVALVLSFLLAGAALGDEKEQKNV
jgi:hypothetical protein